MNRLRPWLSLMRLDRPIGTLLLLWPTLWALWLAAGGLPQWDNLLVFSLGVLVMRSAGCVINDIADRNFDGHVQRTAGRPLATGALKVKQALLLFALLLLLALLLVLTRNGLTIALSLVAVALAACYPFMKRITHLPQLVLGAAFSWAIPMAFAAETAAVPLLAWWLFAANLLWTVAYDTLYAMVDRDDDERIGVRSTARLFGRFDRLAVALLQGATLICLSAVGVVAGLGWPFWLALVVAGGLFAHQQWMVRGGQREACFRAFLANNRIGLVLFVGIAAALSLVG
ncbi:MAG: 4-hydroxybenzoate octaprenyltransferase [Gammaproteobacteria bacterium]|nr:4-hydroxybenzoate octaprenyltransferase [Gammaproteobacteria bacterium]